jgi:hypothetical protein
MKKIFNILLAGSMLVACNNKSNLDTSKDVLLTDTSLMYKSNIMTDTGSVIQASALNKGTRYNVTVANKTSSAPRSTRRTNAVATNQTTSTTTTTTTRRRGWSKAAKDATIGGVGGAVTGAIISKNHVKGAIIGGVLGAAGGYILGRSKDKKEGRY